MGSSSHDLGAELRKNFFTVNCDTFSNEEKVAAVVPVTSVVVTCSVAMLALSFCALLIKCLIKNTRKVSTRVSGLQYGCLFESVLTIWCSSLLEDARAIPSV